MKHKPDYKATIILGQFCENILEMGYSANRTAVFILIHLSMLKAD